MRAAHLAAALLLAASGLAHAGGPRFDQRLGAQLPLEASFRDSDGAALPLRAAFGGPPVVLVFGYAGCRNLCPTLVRGVAEALTQAGLAPGRDYRALFLSIDGAETDVRLRAFAQDAVPPEQRAAWRFLRGDAAATHAVMNAAGFSARPAGDGQIAHGAGLVVLTPQGRVSQVLFGVRFDAAALRRALARAAREKTGTPVTAFLLTCLHLDGFTGRNTAVVLWALRLACGACAALFALWLLRTRRVAA